MGGTVTRPQKHIRKYTIPRRSSPIGPVEGETQDVRGGNAQGANVVQVFLRHVGWGE